MTHRRERRASARECSDQGGSNVTAAVCAVDVEAWWDACSSREQSEQHQAWLERVRLAGKCVHRFDVLNEQGTELLVHAYVLDENGRCTVCHDCCAPGETVTHQREFRWRVSEPVPKSLLAHAKRVIE